ncbi:hypothetical protein KFK09_010778 [Dendrobium nobile]|uniref:Uncharacterized protein n=1 Tax=Dendrobium nobile TaxID=94219 RepID=A0A8T3BGK6_DENNO|nr:hypothetical protein KFK09_010778 [Dendrobium nobile]
MLDFYQQILGDTVEGSNAGNNGNKKKFITNNITRKQIWKHGACLQTTGLDCGAGKMTIHGRQKVGRQLEEAAKAKGAQARISGGHSQRNVAGISALIVCKGGRID